MYALWEAINILPHAYSNVQNLMFRVMIYALLNVKQVNTEVYTFVITAQLNVNSVQISVMINVLVVLQVLQWIQLKGVLEHVLRVIT